MRFVSVLGAIGVGLAIGSAAVLAPLTMGTSTATTTASTTTHWATQWGQQVVGAVRSLATPSAKSTAKSAPNDTDSSSAIKLAAPAQDGKTINYVAQPGSSGTAKVADANIVQKPWATQVTVAPEAAAPKKQMSSKPSSDEQRQSLIRDLQAELKRVGCYDGDPNGQWGAASKRAMASFTERVNASLPFEQPDYILLTLVQGHKGRACGQECPAGQGLAENGRCMPNSILAQAERAKQGDGIKRETVVVAAAAAATSVVASKALDELKAKPRAVQQPSSSIASAWTTTTVETPLETGSVAAAVPAPVRVTRPQQTASIAPAIIPVAPKAAAAATETLVRPAPVLPGRMAIGAPPAQEAAPAEAIKPDRQGTRVAATEIAQPASPKSVEPITAAIAEPAPATRARRIVRSQPVVRVLPAPHLHVAPLSPPHVVKRAPEPVAVVRRPPPAPRYYVPPQYAGNTYGVNTSGSKSRRMVYEMFQRPDRN